MTVPKYGTIDEKIKPKGPSEHEKSCYLRDVFGNRLESFTLHATDSGGALGPFGAPDCRLSDPEIRAAFLTCGRPGWAAQFLALEEVECWRGYVRADYLCVRDGALSVIEIKSDLDTLRRFNEQVRVYSAIADRVTLVVGWNLAARALRDVPWWWDIVLAERGPTSGVRFVPLRDGAMNPDVSTEGLTAMLPMGDVRQLARRVGLGVRRSGEQLRQVVASKVSRGEVRAAIGAWLERLSRQRAERGSTSAKAPESCVTPRSRPQLPNQPHGPHPGVETASIPHSRRA